jgi:SAM-dependent methyltransferase
MAKFSDGDPTYLLNQQYRDSSQLSKRIALHEHFSTNPYGLHQWVFDHISTQPSAHILELGCGAGALWTHNAERIPTSWDITLSDFSEGMLASAQQALSALPHPFHTEVINAQSIPHPDKSFDVVIANHMLYHVPNRQQAIQEIRRVLKDDGHFYATTIGLEHMQQLDELVIKRVPATEHDDTAENFGLETGEAQLRKSFSHVTIHIYDDALKVTEAEPIMQFLYSKPLGFSDTLTPEQIEDIRAEVNAEIEQHGSFYITKVTCLFECWG